MSDAKRFQLEVNPRVPPELGRLSELAEDLWYSWNRSARELFGPLDPELWRRCGHNPKVFLRCIDEGALANAAADPVFMANYNRVVTDFDTYHGERGGPEIERLMDPPDLVAYFSAEFGFHESFPIYSGGLGILAGHHCKTASDLCLPFVGVGLLYRQGYFQQTIDGEGNQVAHYADSNFSDLPVTRALDADGNPIDIDVPMAERDVRVAVWRAKLGRAQLVLLDTNLQANRPEDREITHVLYGGDRDMRMRQEIVLGIGGVRALRAVGLAPTVWHVNEGHAAFQGLERIREYIEQGLDFDTALEAVSGATVFTTHTPVPAGHDHFPEPMMRAYFERYASAMGIDLSHLTGMGHVSRMGEDFNMTVLAVRTSRHHNGVSRIHGDVSAEICAPCWPQVPTNENPMRYVTNGVHVTSVLAKDWVLLFDRFVGAEWRNHIKDIGFWERLDEIPDHLFWSVNQSIKSQMLYSLRETLMYQHLRNQVSEAHLDRILQHLDPANPNVLTVGFARRFATYKRATLLFNDLDWFRQIASDEQRPIVFVFAGKAHPADQPGQEMIRSIHRISNMPEFVGKVLLIEGYDLGLARRLLPGVDVWLNTPVYPQEASGTSGMKAAMNGTINLSVLDGWWAEGYDGHNGWAIKPSPHEHDPSRRDREDARTLYELLQDQVVPLYYDRNKQGYSPGWVAMAKRSMATILPRFNMERVLNDYATGFYKPAARQGRALTENNHARARELAQWKSRVHQAWPNVTIRQIHEPVNRIEFEQSLRVEVAVRMNGLSVDDLAVELLLCERPDPQSRMAGGFNALEAIRSRRHKDEPERLASYRFQPIDGLDSHGEQRFVLDMQPEWCGRLCYRVRVFPFNRSLTHVYETGHMTRLT